MCVLAFAWRAHPRWQLVAIGNRDELHDRPASPLARWDDPDHLIAGRDLQSGGIWLGVSEQGRFAVVTNLRGFGGPEPDRPSRGQLTRDYLTGSMRPEDIDAAAFNPFNLLLADRDSAHFVSNRPHPVHAALAPGLYGLSNAALDEPWPKTLRLKEALLHWLIDDGGDPAALLAVLREETLPATGLREAAASDIPLEPAISPPFIRNPVYGTRCSTVVAIDSAGQGVIIERRFTRYADVEGETRLTFEWGTPNPSPRA
jgi:uncharacterized protein with NRDE domain